MGFISSTHAHFEVGYVFDPTYAGLDTPPKVQR